MSFGAVVSSAHGAEDIWLLSGGVDAVVLQG
jgi:hypothetical protein